MARRVRNGVYDRIVAHLADHGWHDTRELTEFTSYPGYWLQSLKRDPRFDVDDANGRLRLRPT